MTRLFILLLLIIKLLVLPVTTQATATLVADSGATTSSIAAAASQLKSDSGPLPLPPSSLETSLRGGFILLLFVIIAFLIATRRLPAMVALPLMAIGIGLGVGLPLIGPTSALASIVEGINNQGTKTPAAGAFRLYESIIYILFGGMFARFISDAKIAERIVKFTAEFGGEDPYLICLLMALVNAVIFTAGGGLPIIIMIGTVMFPILLSLGVSPVLCGCLLLLSFPVGVFLGPAFWGSQAGVFGVELSKSMQFHVSFAAIMGAVLVLFLTVEFLTMKRGPVSRRGVLLSLLILGGFLLCVGGIAALDRYLVSTNVQVYDMLRNLVLQGMVYGLWAVLAIGVLDSFYCKISGREQTIHWNLLTPILPLLFLLVLGFSWHHQGKVDSPVTMIVPAFIVALAYGVITTPGERLVQRLSRTIMDGIADVAAPVILMLGIGMLIAAANHPESRLIIQPLLRQVMPTSSWGFLIFFILASPFALYRGPLNANGLGAGLAQIMKEFLPAGGPMGAIMSVGMLQDPTTSQYVWTTGYLKLSMNAMLFKLFFYSVIMMVCGLLLSVQMFFPGGILGLLPEPLRIGFSELLQLARGLLSW